MLLRQCVRMIALAESSLIFLGYSKVGCRLGEEEGRGRGEGREGKGREGRGRRGMGWEGKRRGGENRKRKRDGKGGREVEEKEGKEGGRGGRVKSPTYDSTF